MHYKLQVFIFILLVFAIIIKYFLSLPKYKDGDLVRIRGVVFSEPVIYSQKQYLKLSGLKVYLPLYPEVFYGDSLVIEGQVKEKRLVNPKLISLTQDKQSVLPQIRNKIIIFYKSSLPEPYSSLISGMVLGSKNMPSQFWNQLRNTGTAHMVVASGTNVALVSGFVLNLLVKFINRKLALFVSIFVVVVYMFFSGLDAPIIRASIMAIFTFIGQLNGRVIDSWRNLILSGLLMLLINPNWITDLGFILSFVATLSLMVFQKPIDNKFKFLPLGVRESLSTSLAAQVGVLPIMYLTFGQFNLLSPLINLLVNWVVSPVMVIGIVAGIVGLIVAQVGSLILLVSLPLVYWFVKVVQFFGN